MTTSFKERFLNRPTVGSWITVGQSEIAEVMTRCAFDWLVIDMEHSAITLDLAQNLVRTIELAGGIPFIRVEENQPALIKRALDTGAHGVVVPMVNTAEEAVQAVAAAKYPPEGRRGVGLGRAQGYGVDFERYRKWQRDGIVVIIQIEDIRGVDRLEEILATPGIDGFFVGPYDLSGSLGIPGEFEHPKMQVALKKIQRCVQTSKIPAGFHVVPPDPQLVSQKFDEGYRFIAYSLDTLLLSETCQTGLKRIKENAKRIHPERVPS
jgi:2-keto-3-deoxy-L-rhamnonate aldolase RhmA